MAGEVDVFSRLSKLIENSAPESGAGRMNDAALDRLISSYIDDSNSTDYGGNSNYNSPQKKNSNNNNSSSSSGNNNNNNLNSSGGAGQSSGVAKLDGGQGHKTTPYDAWRARQNNVQVSFRQPKKLNEQQWDKLVGKMFKHSKLSQRSAVQDQNQGFAEELGGHDFKPKINKQSLNLSKTMKSIHIRLPEMLAEKRHEIEKKKEERAKEEVAQCSFAPKLIHSKFSEKINKKLDSSRSKFLPNDLIKFKEEAEKRKEVKKQIIEEIESKELTFKPQINTRSNEMHSKLIKENEDLGDRALRFSALGQRTSKSVQGMDLSLDISQQDGLVAGTAFYLESDHPYKHNISEYTKVKVPGAKRYKIEFDEKTCTENINDYIKFYRDDSHTTVWGAAKYSGGRQVDKSEKFGSLKSLHSLSNWPGLHGRPALVIKDSMFVIYFKTNGSLNDWGYKMTITPYFDSTMEMPQFTSSDFNVTLASSPMKGKRESSPIHNRLYIEGMESKIEQHNTLIDLFQSKLNIPFRPWESARNADPDNRNTNAYSSQRPQSAKMKATMSSSIAGIDGQGVINIAQGGQGDYKVNLVEFEDSVAFLWKNLRTTSSLML